MSEKNLIMKYEGSDEETNGKIDLLISYLGVELLSYQKELLKYMIKKRLKGEYNNDLESGDLF